MLKARWLGLLILPVAVGLPAYAQVRAPKPPVSTPAVIVGPASLTAWSNTTAQVGLAWPAVAGAEKYRLTRIESAGDAEVTIEELPSGAFVLEGAACVANSSQPGCGFQDVTKFPPGYPHAVVSGKVYRYRVWAIFAGPIVSPPSAPATVLVK